MAQGHQIPIQMQGTTARLQGETVAVVFHKAAHPVGFYIGKGFNLPCLEGKAVGLEALG